MRINWSRVKVYTGGTLAALCIAAPFWTLICVPGCAIAPIPHGQGYAVGIHVGGATSAEQIQGLAGGVGSAIGGVVGGPAGAAVGQGLGSLIGWGATSLLGLGTVGAGVGWAKSSGRHKGWDEREKAATPRHHPLGAGAAA